MGIRVHKQLGYGLTDLQITEGEVADPRVNGPYVQEGRYDDPRRTADFLAWLEERQEEGNVCYQLLRWALQGDEAKWEPTDSLAWEPEGGDDHVLLLTPPGHKDWYRFDNIIDWVEETRIRPDGNGQTLEPRVDVLKHGPWPYSGAYMDARTGERLDLSAAISWQHFRSDPERCRDLMEEAARDLGFADAAEADRWIAPAVPEEVRVLAEFLGVFTSPEVCNQLRPILYTWWC